MCLYLLLLLCWYMGQMLLKPNIKLLIFLCLSVKKKICETCLNRTLSGVDMVLEVDMILVHTTYICSQCPV